MTTGYQPKCLSCVDCYNSRCNCQKSVYSGIDLDNIPWEGYSCFLSQRKWGHDKPKKKRRKKYPSMTEFEFGVSI